MHEDAELIHSGFSSVLRVKRPSFDGARYGSLPGFIAVKCVDANANRPPHDIRQEVALLTKLTRANNIVTLLSHSQGAEWRLEMPFYPMTLAQLLQKPSFMPNQLQTSFDAIVWSIVRQACRALASLEEAGIAHRDLKPANFLLGPSGRLVLVDFDVAYDVLSPPALEAPDRKIFDVGTTSYKPPELLFGSRDYDAQALDRWALGATLAELFCPLELYDDSQEDDWRFNDAPSLPSFMRRKNWRRVPLFGHYQGDIALIGRIFRIRGTPTIHSWPEAASLPDFDKIQFKSFERQSLSDCLPNLPTSDLRSRFIDILDGLLSYPPAQRTKASALLCESWLADDAVKQEQADRTLAEWMT